MSLEIIAALLSFLFTLMVLSYLIGDNALFRFAIYVFVGVSAGYVAVVVWNQVVFTRLVYPLVAPEVTLIERGLTVVPLVLSVLLLTKLSRDLQGLGTPAVAYLVGIGAAVAIGGALTGTLVPQAFAAIDAFDTSTLTDPAYIAQRWLDGALMLLGTVTALLYFQFGAKKDAKGQGQRSVLMKVIALVGQVFIAITFGALFAGAYAAALTALIERLYSLVQFFQILPGLFF
jgi:hypothetical protein